MAHFVRQAVYKGEFIFYFEVWNNGSFDDLVFFVVKKKLWPPPPKKNNITYVHWKCSNTSVLYKKPHLNWNIIKEDIDF